VQKGVTYFTPWGCSSLALPLIVTVETRRAGLLLRNEETTAKKQEEYRTRANRNEIRNLELKRNIAVVVLWRF
jgi:hypothetical protein